jgi:hypothetical protein
MTRIIKKFAFISLINKPGVIPMMANVINNDFLMFTTFFKEMTKTNGSYTQPILLKILTLNWNASKI